MSTHHVLCMVSCIGHLTLLALIFRNSNKLSQSLILGSIVLSLFVWNAADLAEDYSNLAAWPNLDSAAATMTMPLAFHFVAWFVGKARKIQKWIIASYLYFGWLFVVCLFLAIGSFLSIRIGSWGAGFADSEIFPVIMLIGILIESVASFLLLFRHLQITPDEVEQSKTKLVIASLSFGVFLGSTDLWEPIGIKIQLGHIGSLISAILLAIAASKFRLIKAVEKFEVLIAVLISGFIGLLFVSLFFVKGTILLPGFSILVIGILSVFLAAQIKGIFERRFYERQLRTIGRFSAQIMHDLKNPLAAAQCSIDYLVETSHQNAQIIDMNVHVERLHAQIARISAVIEHTHLLAEDKIQRWPLDLNRLLESLLSQRPQKNSNQIVSQFEKELPKIEGDWNSLCSAFENVITNAEEAAPVEPIKISTGSDTKNVWVEISDDGKGIDARMREYVFDDFFSGKRVHNQQGKQSRGLGLGFVKHIVKLHNGDIRIEAARGTVVRIIFPRCVEVL